ncbi:MAG: isochorismatase family protein [Planctomycetaceae bacterium]
MPWRGLLAVVLLTPTAVVAVEPEAVRPYANRLVPIERPAPLLADHPEWCAPLVEERHFAAPPLVEDEAADLAVRAWRFSYNARGIVEIPNTLRGGVTALIVVHPWGIDDGQGWRTPEPAGVADFCTPRKNALAGRHTREVVRPFVNRLRGLVDCVVYSLPGVRDPIRARCYRSFGHRPDAAERAAGAEALKGTLAAFDYRGGALPDELSLSVRHPVRDYFRQFPGLDAGDRFDPPGFWKLPIPVTADLDVDPDDVVAYDDEGYEPLREFLHGRGVRHVLLAGYATDMCYCRTTAGYENLSRDFNVFLVGDATLATFPASLSPREAVTAALALASRDQLVTQISWVRPLTEAGR